MTLTDALVEVGKFVGGSAVLLAAVAWLIRVWISHGLGRDLANHKAALERASAVEVERLRHELELVSADVTKRTTLLNEKRAEIISELYKKIVEFMTAAERYVEYGELVRMDGAEMRRAQGRLSEASRALYEYYPLHKIYFSEKLSRGLDELYKSVRFAVVRAPLQVELDHQDEPELNEKRDAAWNDAAKAVRENGAQLMRQIEKEFRDLLGVKDSV
jgi:hypothetical protein